MNKERQNSIMDNWPDRLFERSWSPILAFALSLHKTQDTSFISLHIITLSQSNFSLLNFCMYGQHEIKTVCKTVVFSLMVHSFLTAKQLFPGLFTFFYLIFQFLRPEHDCYAKFTSCST